MDAPTETILNRDVEAEFKVVPLSANRLKRVAGIEELPLNWQAFLADAD